MLQIFKSIRKAFIQKNSNQVAPLFAMYGKADHSMNYVFKYLVFNFLESFN